jgi:hypothetical protein
MDLGTPIDGAVWTPPTIDRRNVTLGQHVYAVVHDERGASVVIRRTSPGMWREVGSPLRERILAGLQQEAVI